MVNKFLVTYRDGKYWDFLWMGSEEEVREWLQSYEDEYSNISAMEIDCIRTIR